MSLEHSKGNASKVRLPDEDLVLVGPPKRLSGMLRLENGSDEPVVVEYEPLKPGMRNVETKKQVSLNGALRFTGHLAARETKTQRAFCSVDPHTPAGTYESEIMIGDTVKKITLIVQNDLSISLNPDHIFLVGIGPGKKHTVAVQLANNGNIPIEVPKLKHSTTLDMDLFCRNLALAVRESGDKGNSALLDTFVGGLKKDMAGWLELHVDEAGQRVDPGHAILLHITLTLPKDIHLEREYEGDIRIYDKALSYTIISDARGSGPEA